MANKPFALDVVTPNGRVIAKSVTSVVAPGADGYIGIMANHRPLMTVLTAGVLELETTDGVREVAAVTNGFLEVSENRCTILADSAELPADINAGRAREAYERAKRRLGGTEPGVDVARAREALRRAEARLKTLERAGRS